MKLRRLFQRLNKLYFNNLLPDVDINTNDRKVKTIEGYLYFGEDKRSKPSILIYTCHKNINAIMIHEMIHLEQWLEKMPIRHDKHFKEREKLINADFRDKATTKS